LPEFALFLLVAGLLIQIPSIPAQEPGQGPSQFSVEQEPSDSEGFSPINQPEEDPYRAAERDMHWGSPSPSIAQTPGTDIWVIVRMVLVLALAAAAIYGIVYIFKRASKQTPTNDPFLKILANAHLGVNRYVHIVSVGSRAWLLGSGESGVNLISEIDDQDVINAMLLDDSRKTAETTQGRFHDFLAIMRRLGTPAKTGAPGADEIRKRRERLRGL